MTKHEIEELAIQKTLELAKDQNLVRGTDWSIPSKVASEVARQLNTEPGFYEILSTSPELYEHRMSIEADENWVDTSLIDLMNDVVADIARTASRKKFASLVTEARKTE